ncbi:MAG: TetR/AcrR family transcriptional regulator [Salibacteraceae bacterium]
MTPINHAVQIRVNRNTFLKDPLTSDLGHRIVFNGVRLMHDLGFEQFTFRKLAADIGSTEASIYRYFESKHKLLLYYISWYWNWTEYRLALSITNIDSPKERLERAIRLLTSREVTEEKSPILPQSQLYRIVIEESSKAYLNKSVDEINQDGVFSDYKRIVATIAEIILEINPKYKYPHMLISTVVEGAHHERYFAQHLPRLTDSVKGEDSIECFFLDMVLKSITE